MSNSVKVALTVSVAAILVAVIAAITSVTIVGGDVASLIRNFGIVAVFLVTNIPILIGQIKARDTAKVVSAQTADISAQTTSIEKKVNGELQAMVKAAVSDGVSHGIGNAVQQLSTPSDDIPGQENRSG